MTRAEERRRKTERLRVALDRLERGGTYADAAYVAGFADESHFSRTCKQRLGVRPREASGTDWRERLAA
jgi:AraC-like DNA-binding protein